ncbi:hypothetical protein RHMOL_Rhmol13G0223400 [Rhododendron molle]|uniref:Uncharacterized protein n=1 Tax=Rhododendron molle TaxID=49168 RepID=A0ACC0LAZ1_RHOML|nr:hypothetical protein RHMOL_Rhmol13G0223400 [Rhododendron molle]
MRSVFTNSRNYHHLTEEAAMTTADSIGSPTRLQGQLFAMVVCFILGLGSLVAWQSMLTISDYYYELFPKYHPARVLTLVYQPFALGTIAILAHTEAKSDTRQRNMTGYILFFLSTLALLVVSTAKAHLYGYELLHILDFILVLGAGPYDSPLFRCIWLWLLQLDLATSGKGGIGNYIGICVIVAAFGVADAHVEGGMVGDLSLMCPNFMQSFLAGLAAAGALTSALRLITKAAFEKSANGLRKGVGM